MHQQCRHLVKFNLIIILVTTVLLASIASTSAQDDIEILLPFFSNTGNNTSVAGSKQNDEETNSHTDNMGVQIIEAATKANMVEDQYIVVLKENPTINAVSPQAVQAMVNSVIAENVTAFGGSTIQTYKHALAGFAAELNADALAALQKDTRVEYIEPNQIYTISNDRLNPTWGLDRIDERDLPLDNRYRYGNDGTGVDVYVIDTGVQSNHSEFGGRVVGGYSAIGGSYEDCHGHGTHVAGTIGSSSYGVTPNVSIYAVRVLDCDGIGSTADIIAGVDWVTRNADGPSIANMSLGGPASLSEDIAVRNSIASGVFYAVASGNSNADACQSSPSRVSEAMTVNASTASDARAAFSNYGLCTDIFAPGRNIKSAWIGDDNDTNTISGTSMASPHVAGVAASYLADNPTASVQQVFDALLEAATPDKISNPGSGSPNLLLYYQFSQAVQSPGDQLSPVASNISLQIEVNNPENRELTFSATDLPTGLSINSSTGLITGSPDTKDAYQTTISVGFSESGSESTSFKWLIVDQDSIIQYDFESQQGWETNPNGTDTATSGIWERANPEQTTVGEADFQLDAAISGQNILVTAGSAGSSVGDNDVDDGTTSIRSPDITIPADAEISISFFYYLAHLDNASDADYLRVSVVGETTAQILTVQGAAQNNPANWSVFNGDLTEFAGQTIFLLVEAADAGEASLIEAAIDDVVILITSTDPLPIPTALGDADCSGEIDAVDALVVLQFIINTRTDGGECPLADTETMLNAAAADVNASGRVDAVDALLISQCSVDLNNVLCPLR